MKQRGISHVFCSLLLLAAPWACGGGGTEAPGHLGSAGEITVEVAELEIYVREEARVGLAGMEYPARERALREFITRKSLAAAGEKAGLGDDPAVRQADFGWKMKNQPDLYWRTQVTDKVEVSEEELREYVDPQEYYHIGTIVKGSDEGGLEEAQEVHRMIIEGADFAETAKEHSRGLLAEKGGDMGWRKIPNPYIDEKSAEAIRALEVGAVTDPVETQIGWVLYKLNAFRSADDTFALEREEAEARLRERKIVEERQRRTNKFYDEADIVYLAEREGHPIAVVDGVPLLSSGSGGEDSRHSFYSDIETYDVAQKKAVAAYLVMREVERLGLDAQAVFSLPREVNRIKSLSQLFIRKSIEGRAPEVSDADVKAEYERYYLPEIYTVQIVLTGSREKAEEAHRRAEAGEELQDIVTALKEEGEMAIRGGQYGPMSLADMPADARAAVEGLADGEYTGVMSYGGEGTLAVIQKISSETIDLPPLEAVEKSVRSKLLLQRRSDVVKDFMKEYTEGLEIVVNEKALRNL